MCFEARIHILWFDLLLGVFYTSNHEVMGCVKCKRERIMVVHSTSTANLLNMLVKTIALTQVNSCWSSQQCNYYNPNKMETIQDLRNIPKY